jgi:hypothetical protein
LLRPRRIALLAVLILAAIPPSAYSATYAPRTGKTFHGGVGGYTIANMTEFARLSGRRPAVYGYFFTPEWLSPTGGDLRWQASLIRQSASQGARAMFQLSTSVGGLQDGPGVITPRGIALGGSDPYLIALGDLIAASGQVVYVRPLGEMNNFHNPYCAFNGNGSRRGRAYSTRAFRQAWRRMALLLRGGNVSNINRSLARLRLPPVRTARTDLARARVALLWTPFTVGLPDRRGNRPSAYWPGARYVDWVGTSFFAGSSSFSALERFYRARKWRRKPFAHAEWSLWGREDPRFIRRLFRWIRRHRRVKLEMYNQGALLPPKYALRYYPRSARQLRRQMRSRRFNAYPRLAPP